MAVSRSNDHLKESDPKRAREVETQIVVMTRIVQGMVWLVGMSGIAMTFPNAWQVGVSLLASASVSAILLGFAAKPSIENALASLTIALTQPFLIEDQVQVNGEIGHIEEIQSQYVIVRTLDERRLVVPLTWFLGNIFQNWSRNSPRQIAQCKVFVDYTFPVPRVRQAFLKFARTHPLYDQRHAALLVTGCTETTIELTCQISVANAMEVVQVTSDVREAMVEFISNAQKQQVFSEGSNTGSNPVGGGGGSSIKGRSGGIGLAHTLETIGLLGGGGSEQQNNRPDSPPLPPLPPLTKEDEKMGDGSKAYQCASIKARLAALQKDPSKTTASTTTAADACTTTTPVDTTGMTTARQAAPDHIQVNVEDLTFNSNSNGLTRRSVREVEKVEKDNEKAAMPPETKASEKYQLSEP
ncbi:hypothetical protein BX616_006362 [Lobosporangium transversale]|nr:hypothetical protein BX616_006362 [Lobosporangium transversale]